MAEQARDHADMREVANAITDRMEPGDTDAVTVWLAETIKVVIAKIIRLRQDGVFAPKEAKEMAEALRALVSAQNVYGPPGNCRTSTRRWSKPSTPLRNNRVCPTNWLRKFARRWWAGR